MGTHLLLRARSRRKADVIRRRTATATIAVPNTNTHHPVIRLPTARATIAVPRNPNVIPRRTARATTVVPNQPVYYVHMALARIAVHVIQVLGVPLKVFPVETVVSEKNVTKSVNSSAVTTAVTVARAKKEARVAREAITVVASEVITEEDLISMIGTCRVRLG